MKPSEVIQMALTMFFGNPAENNSKEYCMCYAIARLEGEGLIDGDTAHAATQQIRFMLREISNAYTPFLKGRLIAAGLISADISMDDYIVYARAHYMKFILELEAKGL